MSHERDARAELTILIIGRTATEASERILAAGYRRPRTITTVEELDALPDWSVIRAGEVIFVKSREGNVCWATLASGFAGSSKWVIQVHASVTVLHELEDGE